MAVRLLAKFTCSLNAPASGTAHTGVGSEVSVVPQPSVVTWWPGVGLIAEWGRGGWYDMPMGVMTLDGRYCDRSDELMGDCYWPARNTIVKYTRFYRGGGVTDDVEFFFEPIAFTPQHVGPPQPPFTTVLYGRSYIKLADRGIFFYPIGKVIIDPKLGYTYEHSFRVVIDGVEVEPEGPPAPFGTSGGIARPGRSETEVVVVEDGYSTKDPKAIFYDTVNKVFTSPVYHFGINCYNAPVYATDWGVFVTGHNYVSNPDEITHDQANQIRIWSLEVHPTILLVPEVFKGEVKSGQVVTYRVKVTGDQDDPAEGELINWLVTGAGLLLTAQSKTDADGYATALVQYGLAEVGPSTVGATLTC